MHSSNQPEAVLASDQAATRRFDMHLGVDGGAFAVGSLDPWVLEHRSAAVRSSSAQQSLCWQDPATPLSVWQVEAFGGSHYRLRFAEDLIVDILPDRTIRVSPRCGLNQSTVDHFLADQVFPRLLAHAGQLVVHAGAISLEDAAVLLLGPSGRGKSTLTASFYRAGMPLMGDDALILSLANMSPLARAVYPSLRLFPDSIAAVMPDTPSAGPVAYYANKERIDIPAQGHAALAPLPVRAIYSIAAPSLDGRIRVRRMSVTETCMALVESSFALDPSDVQQARRRLDDSSALARVIPAFEIVYPRDYGRLSEVRQAILDQLAELESA
jgi:hypothetical protein